MLEKLAANGDRTKRAHKNFMAFLKKCNDYAESLATASLRDGAMELL